MKNPSPALSPAGESEKDRFAREFIDKLGGIIRRIVSSGIWRGKSLLPWYRVEPDDLVTRVWQYADRSRRNNKEFRKFWRKPGLEAEDIQRHYLWHCWVRCAIADQCEDFYKITPRIVSWDQIRFLRIAAARYGRGRMFLPFVQDQNQEDESRLLNKLKKNGKLAEVPSSSGIGIFRVDEELGPLALIATNKKRGGGVELLKELVHMGFLREVSTGDIDSFCYFDESGGMLTLELTQEGYGYISKFKSGDLSLSIDQEGGVRMEFSGTVLTADEDSVSNYLEKSKKKPFDDPDFLKYCAEKGGFIGKHREAYMLLALEGLTQEEVCARTGINDSVLSKWKKKYDKMGMREDLQSLYVDWVTRSRD